MVNIVHNSVVAVAPELRSVQNLYGSYLGRSWKEYSRTVFSKCVIDDVIDPTGWLPWNGGSSLSSLYYSEYMNSGGSATRITWLKYDPHTKQGAHTLGQAQCFLFWGRIYSNGTDIDGGFASTRRRQCPQSGGNSNLAPLDLVTLNSFDNNYFRNLVQRKGLLQSDQVLFTGSTAAIVTQYSGNPRTFAADFAAAMIKMPEIQPLLGQNGIIRRVCSAIN